MSKIDNREYYDAFADGYDDKRHDGYHKMIDEQAAEIVRRVGEGKRILEVGCGTGLILQRVVQFASKAQGIDLSEGMLAKAKERGLDVQQADATNLPFEDETFDVVYSFKVLAHLENWDKAIEEMMRVLKPDGFLIVDVYNKKSVRYLLKKLFGPRKTSQHYDEKAIFTRFWTPEEAQRAMPKNTQLVSISGIRLWTLAPPLLKVPFLGKKLEEWEWKFMDSPFAQYAGFLVFTLRKLR